MSTIQTLQTSFANYIENQMLFIPQVIKINFIKQAGVTKSCNPTCSQCSWCCAVTFMVHHLMKVCIYKWQGLSFMQLLKYSALDVIVLSWGCVSKYACFHATLLIMQMCFMKCYYIAALCLEQYCPFGMPWYTLCSHNLTVIIHTHEIILRFRQFLLSVWCVGLGHVEYSWFGLGADEIGQLSCMFIPCLLLW